MSLIVPAGSPILAHAGSCQAVIGHRLASGTRVPRWAEALPVGGCVVCVLAGSAVEAGQGGAAGAGRGDQGA